MTIDSRFYEEFELSRDPGIHGDECTCDDCLSEHETEEEEELNYDDK